MKLLYVFAVVAIASASANADPQGGFFDNVRNFFRPNQPARRPPPPQNRPPPPQNRPPPQQQFRQQPQQQLPARRPNLPVRQNSPPRQAGPTLVRNAQPQVAQNVVRPVPDRPVVNRPPPQSAPVRQAAQSACDASSKPVMNGCPGACPNEVDDKGRAYILTYKINDVQCSNFTGHEAEEYCKLQGGHAVSLDDNEKALFFRGIAIRDRRRYFWTGGRIDHGVETVTWPSGKREGYVRGQRFWSHTGGKEPQPEPQPDNRDGNEICIGVLNNFYADGVKWHDVACHHRKPTICEL